VDAQLNSILSNDFHQPIRAIPEQLRVTIGSGSLPIVIKITISIHSRVKPPNKPARNREKDHKDTRSYPPVMFQYIHLVTNLNDSLHHTVAQDE
jgi:hypothetical protein